MNNLFYLRWSHINCKITLTDDEAIKLVKQGFSCSKCQKDKQVDLIVKEDINIKEHAELYEEICKSINIVFTSFYFILINNLFKIN